MLTLLKNTCFLEIFIKYNFIFNNFKIKVMEPQISVNFLFDYKKKLKLANFIYLNFNIKILVALATFNKNYPYMHWVID